MKKSFLILITLVFALTANAQKLDTTIYNSCRTSNDTLSVKGNNQESNFDSCPQFRNGYKDISKFISDHLHYPASAKKNHIEERVIISVVIEKNGKVPKAKIEHGVSNIDRGISEDLNKEALSVIMSMPKWSP